MNRDDCNACIAVILGEDPLVQVAVPDVQDSPSGVGHSFSSGRENAAKKLSGANFCGALQFQGRQGGTAET